MQTVDFWHLVEKLGAAARLLDDDPIARRLARWRLRLLNVEHAATRHPPRTADVRTRARRVGETQPVHEAITYLDNHRGRMNYAAARAAGPPIGSARMASATCKTLVQVRMKRAGSRWKTNTASPRRARLRALATSDRRADAIDFTLRPLRKAVRVGGVIA
ncbi:MAG: hypothetical protein HS111_12380 [Kofleriaceae bacterium]|nr:hypothetical protein [Kofleriaceae bacterium]